MPASGHVLSVQGGGAGAHDDWDAALVASLRERLGSNVEIHYPRMPGEDDPAYARWRAAVAEALAALADGVIVVGHSVRATILVHHLADSGPPLHLTAIVLLAAPFVGAGGWPGDEFALPSDLGVRLPQGVPVHLFHGTGDETVPPAHCALYARAIPQAQVHLLPARDHQLNNDLTEVADVIAAL